METKIELRIGNNSILVQGTEEFIREQIDIFYDFCESRLPSDISDSDTVLEETNMTPKSDYLPTANARDFYAQYSPNSQAESALVLAGWLYTQRGASPFEVAELKALFDEIGAPSPARLDNTIKSMQRDSKKLFQSVSGGLFRPTIYGENYFKSEMRLSPFKK